MFIGSSRSLTLITLSLIKPFFLLTFTRLFRLGQTFTFLLVLVCVMRTRLLVVITTRRRLMWLIRWSLIRGGLVPPLVLVWRTASNNIGLIDQRRGVFRFLNSRNLSMERFTCGLKVHLHEDGSNDMLHIKVGNSNGLNDGRCKRVILRRKIVEEDHVWGRSNPAWVIWSKSDMISLMSVWAC